MGICDLCMLRHGTRKSLEWIIHGIIVFRIETRSYLILDLLWSWLLKIECTELSNNITELSLLGISYVPEMFFTDVRSSSFVLFAVEGAYFSQTLLVNLSQQFHVHTNNLEKTDMQSCEGFLIYFILNCSIEKSNYF